MKNSLLKARDGEEPPKGLSPQQLQDWNRYIDWMDSKGMKGSKELDKGENAFKWLAAYQQENPQTTITKDSIKSVQYEMEKLANNARDFARRKNNPNAENLMRGISQLDGIPGSKTTSFKFPDLIQKNYHENALVSNRNLGLLNGDMTSQTQQQNIYRKPPPKGVKLEKLDDGNYYYEDENGDLVKYK